MANLAKALENSDEPERACDCLAHLLEVCSEALGAEHLETMEIRRRLGLLFLGQGRPEEGEALLAAYCDPSQANGDEVQARLSCAVVRARCLWAMNRRDDAIQAFRSARMEFVSRFGELFPEVTRLDAYLKREGIDLRD